MAGAIGVAVVGYDLVKKLGDGQEGPWHQVIVIASLLAFGLGVGLIVTLPITLAAADRVTLVEAVRNQRLWNLVTKPTKYKHNVVGSEVLHGHPDVIEFQQQMINSIAAVRGYWSNGIHPPPPLIAKVNLYIQQRDQIQEYLAANRVRASSRRSLTKAIVGITLVVVGYSNATYITNQAVRLAVVTDAATKRAEDRGDKALDAALAQPVAGSVLPTVPSTVLLVFPDKATAAEAMQISIEDLDDSCWEIGRKGEAYDVGQAPDGIADSHRIVLVVLKATTTNCPTSVMWANPEWIRSPDQKVVVDKPDATDTTDATDTSTTTSTTILNSATTTG